MPSHREPREARQRRRREGNAVVRSNASRQSEELKYAIKLRDDCFGIDPREAADRDDEARVQVGDREWVAEIGLRA